MNPSVRGGWRVAMAAAGLAFAACSGDRSRSPACGLAQLAGPMQMKEELRNVRSAIGEVPRGLPGTLPAKVVGFPAGLAAVGYGPDGSLVIEFAGQGFPASPASFALLVVDDSSARVEGILVYDSEPPVTGLPRLGTVTSGRVTVPLYGVRLVYARVSNPRCPLFAQPAQRADS